MEQVGYTFEPFAQNVCVMSSFVLRTGCNYTLYPSARKRDCFPYYEVAFISAFTIIPFSLLNNPSFLFPHIPMLYRSPSKKNDNLSFCLYLFESGKNSEMRRIRNCFQVIATLHLSLL